MSKPRVLLTAFLVGSAGICTPQLSFAQAANDAQLRGTIELPRGPQLPGQNNTDATNDFLRTPAPTAQAQRSQLISARERQRELRPELQRDFSQRRSQPVEAAGPVANPNSSDNLPRYNTPAEPVQSGTTPTPRDPDDDFAPQGFRIGTFDANVSLEQAIGYSSNISNSFNGDAGGFSQTDLRLSLTSNWSRHEVQANLAASLERPFDSDKITRPGIDADVTSRLDLWDGVTLTSRGYYSLSTQGFTSSTLAPGAVDNPLQHSYGSSLNLERSDRKLRFGLRGSLDRNTFDAADLGGGITQSQSDRNNTDYGIAARVGYEVSPAIVPFAEVGYTIREFDQRIDRNGNRRDSELLNLRGGLEFDLGEKLQGELSAGSVNESFEDPNLSDLNGFTINGQLNWSPSRETQIGLTLGTTTNSSITANENGSILYNARLDFDRQINARMGLNAFVDYQTENNTDNNQTLQAGVGLEYWLNRFSAVTVDLEYLDFTSNAANSDFDEVTGRVGIRFQR